MNARCIINIAPPEEDCGRHRAYTRCGKTAHWRSEPEGYEVCEEHCREMLGNGAEVQGIIDGDRVELDAETGEIVRAAA